MFTDWTRTEPEYFYVRGIIFGVVLSFMAYRYAIPAVKWLFKRRAR